MVDADPFREVAGVAWHVVVIGAGPAGCVAAAQLAERGRRVLLVEKGRWPREKVCGGCINHSAIQTLRDAGLNSVLAGGQSLDRVQWRIGAQTMSVPTPRGVAMLRSEFDAALASAAVARGCTFIAETSALLFPGKDGEARRTVRLSRGEFAAEVSAEIVLACDGIGGTSIDGEPWARWKIARRAWIGVAATTPVANRSLREHDGAIRMHVSAGGYVGRVQLADGREHLAAALDPTSCREAGGAGRLVENILASTGGSAGCAVSGMRLRGTGKMTRRRHRLGGSRVLVVGDAGGYVEPFTGEGMAWAVQSAARVAQMLPAPAEAWPVNLAREWESEYAEGIGRRQRRCRLLRPIVHHPALVGALVRFGSLLPSASRGVASYVCGAERQLA